MKSFTINLASVLAISAIAFFSLLLPLVVSAQWTPYYEPMVQIPGVTDITAQNGGAVLSQYVNALYGLAIVIAGMIAVIKLVLAGAKYMMSDSFTSKGAAIEDIKGALLGILIILTAFLILATINPRLTGIDFLPEGTAMVDAGDGLDFLLNFGDPACIDQGTCQDVVCEHTLDGDCYIWCTSLNGQYRDRTAGLGTIVAGAGTDSCYVTTNLLPPPGPPTGNPNTFYCPDSVYNPSNSSALDPFGAYRCQSWCSLQGGTPGETAAIIGNDQTCTFSGTGGPTTQTIQIPCDPSTIDPNGIPMPNCAAAQGQCSSQNGVATVYADYVSCTTAN